jgi:hypothetical protein
MRAFFDGLDAAPEPVPRDARVANNLLRFGFMERDIADGGSDRLIDAVIPHGSSRSPTPSALISTRAPTTSPCSRSATAPRLSPTTKPWPARCSDVRTP